MTHAKVGRWWGGLPGPRPTPSSACWRSAKCSGTRASVPRRGPRAQGVSSPLVVGQALPPANRVSPILPLILFAALLSACANGVHRNVGSYVAAVTVPRTPAAGPRPATAETSGPPVFTFSQACERAAKFDKDVAGALADAARLQIDLKQAQSLVWPRLDVRTYLQVPLSGANIEGLRLFNGGLFLRYDFEKFLFAGDASAIARARIEEKRENLALGLQHLSHDLFLLLADRETLRTEVALRRGMQTQASDTLERVHLLERAGKIKPERTFEYQFQSETSTRLYREAVRRFAEIDRVLGSRLLIDDSREIVVTGFTDLLASMDGLAPPTQLDETFFSALWARRHDARVAEAELFLKEMAVVDARRKRIPALTASFGLGSLALSSTFNQAPLALQLGASMPLLDFGDVKREVDKARIESDLAKRNITLLFLRMRSDVANASAALADAIAARKTTEDYRDLIVRQDRASRQLVSLALVDPIDLLVFQMRAGEAEIENMRARMNVYKAAAEYARASGIDLGAEKAK
jgi:outer membrane protein TolC